MPWPLFNRPSIQLGTLKAFLENRNNNLAVQTSHPYLEVAAMLGPDLYHWISQNPWVSEALYSPLVFPQQAGSAETLAMKYAKKSPPGIQKSFHYKTITGKLESQLAGWVDNCDFSRFDLIGFSVCFHQLFASLAAARAVKKKHPETTIVFGGSSCAAAAGESLLHAFHQIDYPLSLLLA